MKRHYILTFALLALIVLSVGVLWRGGNAVVKGQSNTAQNGAPFDELNRKERAARSGDPDSVHALADEVFNTASFSEIPSEAVEAMKDRLVRAEMEFRKVKSKQRSIEEIDVAKTVNRLANKLNLPAYAKTTPLEVRHLRIGMLVFLPNFIAQEDAKEGQGKKKVVGSKITSKMSPLEAAYVAMLMLQQKQHNAAFQVSPREWRAAEYKRKLERWQAHQGGRSLDIPANPNLSEQGNSNPKVKEIEQAAATGIAALPLTDLQNLPDDLLDTLGVAR